MYTVTHRYYQKFTCTFQQQQKQDNQSTKAVKSLGLKMNYLFPLTALNEGG